ncbi:hypothetical protein AADZ90_014180 [Aestuariibius sp. 2305UL40-4]|uniref:hypothetical protein n=1 Tax=Aestuariibius violaceus TaxID=3234132 RepID=UPI00345E8442
MIRSVILAALCSLPAALPAQTLTRGTCLTSWSGLTEVAARFDMEVTAGSVGLSGGACVATRIRSTTDVEGQDWEADRIAWSGDGLDALPGGLPAQIDIRGQGVRTTLRLGSGQALQFARPHHSSQTRVDLHFAIAHDPVERRVVLTTPSVPPEGENAVILAAIVEDVNLSDATTAAFSAGSFRLTSLVAEIRGNGLFGSFVLPALANDLLADSPRPAEEMQALQANWRGLIDALPGTMLGIESRAAAAAIIDAMPSPDGTLTLSFADDQGLGPARFLPLATADEVAPGDVAATLDGMRIDLGWVPAPGG